MNKYDKMNKEIIDKEFEILQIKNNLSNDNIKKIKSLKEYIEKERNVYLTVDELMLFLKNAMNFDNMQIWILKNYFSGIKTTYNENLEKLFELFDDEKLLQTYDILQNINKNNIENKKSLIKEKKS